MGGNNEEWMIRQGPERMEGLAEGETLYCNRSSTNWRVRHD